MTPDSQYFDRALKSLPSQDGASFEERKQLLYTLEMAVASTICEKSANREISGEEKCFPSAVSSGALVVGGVEFSYDTLEEKLVHESQGGELRLELCMNTFRADAETLLKALSELGTLTKKVAPLRIIIGSTNTKKTVVGGCDPETGRIAFYADDFGGLIAVGLQVETDKDACRINVRQIVAHELTHVFERNPEIQKLLVPVRADLLEHARKGFQSEKLAAIEECAFAINPNYLPHRMKTWESRSGPMRLEAEADQMTSEFWAEACASMAVGSPPNVRGWMPLETVCQFVRDNYLTLVAVEIPSSAKPIKTLHRNITPRLDYISDRTPPENPTIR